MAPLKAAFIIEESEAGGDSPRMPDDVRRFLAAQAGVRGILQTLRDRIIAGLACCQCSTLRSAQAKIYRSMSELLSRDVLFPSEVRRRLPFLHACTLELNEREIVAKFIRPPSLCECIRESWQRITTMIIGQHGRNCLSGTDLAEQQDRGESLAFDVLCGHDNHENRSVYWRAWERYFKEMFDPRRLLGLMRITRDAATEEIAQEAWSRLVVCNPPTSFIVRVIADTPFSAVARAAWDHIKKCSLPQDELQCVVGSSRGSDDGMRDEAEQRLKAMCKEFRHPKAHWLLRSCIVRPKIP